MSALGYWSQQMTLAGSDGDEWIALIGSFVHTMRDMRRCFCMEEP
jgi:hypothetical protein